MPIGRLSAARRDDLYVKRAIVGGICRHSSLVKSAHAIMLNDLLPEMEYGVVATRFHSTQGYSLAACLSLRRAAGASLLIAPIGTQLSAPFCGVFVAAFGTSSLPPAIMKQGVVMSKRTRPFRSKGSTIQNRSSCNLKGIYCMW